MREILFRGKRIGGHKDNTETGTMMYGHLFVDKKGQPKIKWYREEFGSAMTSNVDPNTVGQFTGLHDKNGTRIFEGDIIAATHVDSGRSVKGVVNFRNGCFCVRYGTCYNPAIDMLSEYEVIGNIFDNTELMEDT